MCKVPSKVFCVVIKSTLSQAMPAPPLLYTFCFCYHIVENGGENLSISLIVLLALLSHTLALLKQEIVTNTYVFIIVRCSLIEIQTCTLKIKHTKLVRSINIPDCAPFPSLPYTCPLETRNCGKDNSMRFHWYTH